MMYFHPLTSPLNQICNDRSVTITDFTFTTGPTMKVVSTFRSTTGPCETRLQTHLVFSQTAMWSFQCTVCFAVAVCSPDISQSPFVGMGEIHFLVIRLFPAF